MDDTNCDFSSIMDIFLVELIDTTEQKHVISALKYFEEGIPAICEEMEEINLGIETEIRKIFVAKCMVLEEKA